jgi:RNA polymerase sigma factor (sigma-70 family)
MIDDATLLHRYAEARAEDVFGELVRRHLGGVYSTALRRVGGDTHLAEDVAQVVFVELARNAASLVEHPLLTGWLHATTRNAAANVVRTERRRKLREQQTLTITMTLSDGEPEVDWDQVAPVLDDVIDQLNEPDRAAVLLRFVDQRAFAEIGRTLRVSEDAARMRVDRALDKLRALLARRGIRSTSAALGMALASHAVVAAPMGLAASVTGAAVTATPLVGASTAVGILGFMTTTKFLLGSAAVLALAVLLGTTTYERSVARGELAAVERDYAARLAASAKTEASQRAVEQESAAMKVRADEARAAQTAAARRAAVEEERARRIAMWDPVVEGSALMTRHPELKRALIEQRTAQYRSRYAPLFKTLDLSEAQIGELMGLLLNRSSNSFPFGPESREFKLMLGEGSPPSEIQSRIRALLGEDGYQKYQAFGDAAPARDTASALARILCFSETPLTAEQSNEMAGIIDRHRVKDASTSRQSYDWTAIATDAQAILAAGQMSALDTLRTQREAEQAARRAESESGWVGGKGGKS